MQLLSPEMEKEIKQTIIEVVEKTIASYQQRIISDQRYLRPEEAATYCGISKQTLTKWVYEFGLKQVKVGQVITYDRKDLDHFMNNFKI